MKMVGHATESIYRRYAIQHEAMLRKPSAKLEAWTEEQAVSGAPLEVVVGCTIAIFPRK
jgi:hypothetical protein